MNIVAFGGGGFADEEHVLLMRYVLELTGKARPAVCFVPTASSDSVGYIEAFHQCLGSLDCETSHLALSTNDVDNIEAHLLAQDAIYVGGGNTAHMLLEWSKHGVDRALAKAWMNGTVLCGSSAGSICWFEQAVTDSYGPLAPLYCLGFLEGSNCPHYDSEPERRPTYHELVGSQMIKPGYAADDGVGLHFGGKRLERVVTSRAGSFAYRVSIENGEPVERRITPSYLG